MSAPIGGVAHITANGQQLAAGNSLNISRGSEREMKTGSDGRIHHTETPSHGEITVELFTDGSFDVDTLHNTRDLMVIVTDAAGKTEYLSGAVSLDKPDVDKMAGTVTYRFGGKFAKS